MRIIDAEMLEKALERTPIRIAADKANTCRHNQNNPGLLRFNCPLWRAK